MMMTKMRTFFDFFEITDQHILEIDYLVKLATKLDCIDDIKKTLRQFNPREDESLAVFYKEHFLSDLSWASTQLVCATYYPIQAVRDIEDFGLYFQDKWLDDLINNDFYKFFLKNDLSKKTKKEIIEMFYNELQDTFEQYFEPRVYPPNLNENAISRDDPN